MLLDDPGGRVIGRPPDAVLFHAADRAVTASAFLADAHALAARLPPGRHLVNLCADRYAFVVSFAAALLRGQACILGGDRSPSGLAQLLARFPGCAAVVDDADGTSLPPGTPAIAVSGVPGPAPAVMPPNPVVVRDGGPAAIVFTSGSTGTPVAHPKGWRAMTERSVAAGQRFGFDPAAPAAVVGTVPPQHMYGFETTVLLPLHAAVSSWCGASFYPGDVCAALEAVPAPRVLVSTPLQLRALLRAGLPLPGLHRVISATAPLDAALAAEAEERWNAEVHEIFGATEVGSIASRRTTADGHWTSYPGVSLQARDADTVVVAPHTPATALADVVEMAGADRFRVLGRHADLVKLGGRRASLSGLTHVLTGLDGVEDGVFLAPDDLDGRANARLLAVVVAPGRSAPSILAALRQLLDPVFLPRRVIQVDRLPRNELGKLPRQALLSLVAAHDPPP